MAQAAVGIAGEVFNNVADLVGAQDQQRLLKQAEQGMEKNAGTLQSFMDSEYAKTQPLRTEGLQYGAAGASALPILQDYATNPTMSAGFKTSMKEGLNALQADFATRGSPQSGPAAMAAGRFATGLTNAELDKQQQAAQFLAGMGAQAAPALAGSGQGFYASMYPNLRSYYEDVAGLKVAQGNSLKQMWNQAGQNTLQDTGSSGAGMGAGAFTSGFGK